MPSLAGKLQSAYQKDVRKGSVTTFMYGVVIFLHYKAWYISASTLNMLSMVRDITVSY